jgi:cytochrome c oxidase accessory protein FixG
MEATTSPLLALMTEYCNPRLSPWRRSFQWLTSLIILLLPFCRWNGRSLLRVDFTTLSLNLFGQTLRIDELYLVLFFSLTLGLAFLLVTLVFGRVWCGWACPQTTLSDIAEWLAKRLGLQLAGNILQGSPGRKLLAHLAYLLLALLVGANLVWYFVEPRRFATELLQNRLHYGTWITLLTVAATVYLDFALIRRIMCRDFCPYGRFQTVLADPGTLTLHLPDSEVSRCIDCGACVRSCPMEIDIRRGYQVECINCGRCLDACREVMNRLRQPGLIRYSFGLEGKGLPALLNPRTLLLAGATSVLATILATAIYLKPQASLKVSLSHTAASRVLADNTLATFFSAWVSNRSDATDCYDIKAFRPGNPTPLMLRGQSHDITLAPGANRALQFVVTTPNPGMAEQIEFVLYNSTRTEQARAGAILTPP